MWWLGWSRFPRLMCLLGCWKLQLDSPFHDEVSVGLLIMRRNYSLVDQSHLACRILLSRYSEGEKGLRKKLDQVLHPPPLWWRCSKCGTLNGKSDEKFPLFFSPSLYWEIFVSNWEEKRRKKRRKIFGRSKGRQTEKGKEENILRNLGKRILSTATMKCKEEKGGK